MGDKAKKDVESGAVGQSLVDSSKLVNLKVSLLKMCYPPTCPPLICIYKDDFTHIIKYGIVEEKRGKCVH